MDANTRTPKERTTGSRSTKLYGERCWRCRVASDGARCGIRRKYSAVSGPQPAGRRDASCQRRDQVSQHRCTYHPAGRAARAYRPHRQQEGLRSRPVRRLHGADRRPPRAVVPDAGAGRAGSRHHHHRGHGTQWRTASDAAGLHRSGRLPVRLLHARADHVGDRLRQGRAMPAATTTSANT